MKERYANFKILYKHSKVNMFYDVIFTRTGNLWERERGKEGIERVNNKTKQAMTLLLGL